MQSAEMRAVVLEQAGSPDVLHVRDDVLVPVPGSHDVLVRVRACGVDAHDTAVRRGLLKRGFTPGMVLGHEIAGDVVEVGTSVRTIRPGDRVCCKQTTSCGLCVLCRTAEEVLCDKVRFNEGGLAEWVSLPEDAWVKIPDDVPYASAAVLSCAVGSVYHAAREIAAIRTSERVLVTGAGGGLGLHAIKVARYLGAEVFAVTSSAEKAQAIATAGADHVLVLDEHPLHSRVAELTHGRGIDVVLDTVGAPVFAEALRTLGLRGRHVLIGQVHPEKVELHPARLFGKEQRILGSNGTRRHELEECLRLADAGEIVPVVSVIGGLDRAADAHRAIETGRVTGRIVIDPAL